ncbi:MAG: cell wall hydrolase [Clostridium sp.]
MKKFFSLFLITFLLSVTIFSYTANAFAMITWESIFYPLNQAGEKIAVQAMAKNNITINEEQNTAINVFNYGSGQLKLSEKDIDLMAKLVYAESRGEPFEGKVAVASVVLNRVISPNFPSTVEGVIFQKNAFSCVINGQIKAYPDQVCYDAVYEAIRGKDPTNEALFFYNPAISTCSWMRGKEKVNPKQIGNHLFFKVR